MRTATDRQQYFSYSDMLTGGRSVFDILFADTKGSENAQKAAENEYNYNMSLLGAQKDSDRRSYLYSLFALGNEKSAQQAAIQRRENLYNTIVIIAAIIGSVLIIKSI